MRLKPQLVPKTLAGRWTLAAVLVIEACTQAAGPSAAATAVRNPQPPTQAQTTTPKRTPPKKAPNAPADTLSQWPMPDMKALVAAAIAEGKLPGCVIAVGDKHGVRYLEAFGKRSLRPTQEAMTTDTVFDLASLTKSIVVGTLIAQLSDEKALSVQDRVAKYLPGFAGEGRSNITIAELMLHTSGLPSVTPLSDFEQPAEITRKRLLQSPLSEPRGQFNYSDIGYILLGELIEEVTSSKLNTYANDHIFKPLAMHDTRYGPLPEDLRKRAAPTEDREEVMIRGDVHDPRAYRMGGVAGNAGVFSTAQDLSLFARMMLHGGNLNGAQILSPSAFAQFTEKHQAGHAIRALGWDVLSGYSRLRGHALSAQAFGHGGFTGTSLWVDPGRDLFVIFLSHRVHPDGQGNVLQLIGDVTDVAVQSANPGLPTRCTKLSKRTKMGIDRLVENDFAQLAKTHVGLIVNGASRTAKGQTTLAAFLGSKKVVLQAIMTPEHGLHVDQEGAVKDEATGVEGVPIYSLFGKQRRPTAKMLKGVNALVFDLQDAGVRFFTYMSTLREALVAAKEQGIAIWVLDRPNPLGGEIVEGPTLDPGVRTFVNYHNLPLRHGLTAGELAHLLNDELNIGADLHVQWMDNYYREFLWQDTGIAFVAPSPNLRNEAASLLYPAVAIVESTNVSVGRGTEHPFEWIGAPFIDGDLLAERLNRAPLAGVSFEAVNFTPTARPHAGIPCNGVRLRISNPRSYRAANTGLTLARILAELYGKRFLSSRVQKMIGHRSTMLAVLSQRRFAPAATDILGLQTYLVRRSHYLHYPSCDP